MVHEQAGWQGLNELVLPAIALALLSVVGLGWSDADESLNPPSGGFRDVESVA